MKLTKRQQQVYNLIRQGKNSHEIAAELGISLKTADVHTQSIKQRLGFTKMREMRRALYAEYVNEKKD